jgi:hypothetical protein
MSCNRGIKIEHLNLSVFITDQTRPPYLVDGARQRSKVSARRL